jgi:uncharacterized tellurite resistance protein B-like protein
MEFIDRILSRFHKSAPVSAPLPEPDANMALGALMIRVSKADKSYAVEEIAKIDKILAKIFGINPVEAAKMRALCEKLEAKAPHEGKRLNALRALHAVMHADGIDRPEEETVLQETSLALGFATLPTNLSEGFEQQ